jgi:hypothetical protein
MMRRLLSLAAVLAVGASLSACVIYSGSEGEDVEVRVGDASSVATASEPAETLGAARFDGQSLVVRVASNGCTDAADFAIEVTDGDPAEIKLVRTTPDLCKALVAEGVELRWSYADLGLQAGSAARILNPLRL